MTVSGTTAQRAVGNVLLGECLGKGGMGEVWRGERVSVGGVRKRVAVKRILPEFHGDPRLRERFLAEARITARLEHPNIVQLIDFGDTPELYLVLEYVEGTSLDTIVRRAAGGAGPLPLPAALYIIAEAAEGLDYAHRRTDDAGRPLGIIHRDISPSNILVSRDGAVKVSDFGVAHAADNAVQTMSGVAMGKVVYMAPEQALGQALDKRADVFALGVCLWEAVALRPLLPRGNDQHAAAVLTRGEFPPLATVVPGLPPQLDAIVREALARQPADRTPSAGRLATALRGVLAQLAPGYSNRELARVVAALVPEGTSLASTAPMTQVAPPLLAAGVAPPLLGAGVAPAVAGAPVAAPGMQPAAAVVAAGPAPAPPVIVAHASQPIIAPAGGVGPLVAPAPPPPNVAPAAMPAAPVAMPVGGAPGYAPSGVASPSMPNLAASPPVPQHPPVHAAPSPVTAPMPVSAPMLAPPAAPVASPSMPGAPLAPSLPQVQAQMQQRPLAPAAPPLGYTAAAPVVPPATLGAPQPAGAMVVPAAHPSVDAASLARASAPGPLPVAAPQRPGDAMGRHLAVLGAVVALLVILVVAAVCLVYWLA